jgi:hypothetical protein
MRIWVCHLKFNIVYVAFTIRKLILDMIDSTMLMKACA